MLFRLLQISIASRMIFRNLIEDLIFDILFRKIPKEYCLRMSHDHIFCERHLKREKQVKPDSCLEIYKDIASRQIYDRFQVTNSPIDFNVRFVQLRIHFRYSRRFEKAPPVGIETRK